MLPTRLCRATTHNLKGVSLEIRPGEVTVLTGVSGSGKSSLASDTLYAEGQRRFVESFSPYARQFLERLERPPMESLEPVAAGVSVDRSAPVKSSRSTLATMADLEPYLAGLFATESAPHCPEHELPAVTMTLARATDAVLERLQGQRISLSWPVSVGSREEYLGIRDDLLREGYRRIICDDVPTDVDELKPSAAEKAGRIHVVLDRVRAEPAARSRIAEALETAFQRSAGRVSAGQAWVFGEGENLHLRQGLVCPTCARGFPPPRPGYFSYESPLGACDTCRGFGRILGIDADKVIPDSSLSLADGALRPWRGPSAEWERRQLKKFCDEQGIPLDVPWAKLTATQKKAIWEGKSGRGKERYWGIQRWFEWLESKSYKMHVRVLLSRYRSYDLCPVCQGTRLNESSRWYKLGGLDLGAWHTLEVSRALDLLAEVRLETPHGELLRRELSSRLTYLARVGLGYLSLDRQARTLSGGESQRVTLTAALGTSLHNALFVLDEPTVGLHPADIVSLNELLAELAERQNGVLVIEHEPLIISHADRVIELGPQAGEAGGEVTFDGSVAQARKAQGATARALLGPRMAKRDSSASSGRLRIRGAAGHNLKNLTTEIPLGSVVCICGPSGSGKSSLSEQVLYRAVARHLKLGDVDRPLPHDGLDGLEQVSAVELVDQSPLGRTSRGNPATYTKAWDAIRKAFAAEPQAIAQGYSASHFSFNVAGGRCEACAGEGFETVEMQFLADVSLVCPVCQGKRFKEEVLQVLHRGMSIADVLELTIERALAIFGGTPAVRRALAPLAVLGLGYLRLGQPLSTLSGGEAQRLKLARALAAPKPGTLYVLDEPSAGLHADEVELLIEALRTLVRAGGTVVFVDHDLALIAAADHVIELGPGGGVSGGNLVFEGTPEQLARAMTPTGQVLGVPAARRRPARGRKKTEQQRELVVSGAREHTLKDVSISVPHEKLTVITGPSGSGKSTLAFDVIFAEGQRRFLETLTPYARRFLPTMPRPAVDRVIGVPPAIALEQRTTRVGARSTVATVTEVAHFLRLLFAKLGDVACPEHDIPIRRASAEEVLAQVQRAGERGELLAPVVVQRKGTYLDVFTSAARAGYHWAVADGRRVAVEMPPRLKKTQEHSIDLVVKEKIRLSEIELPLLREALRWGRGSVAVSAGGERRTFSTGGSCPECGFASGELDPRFFSFNTVQGRCAVCEGTGVLAAAPARGKKVVQEAVRPCPSCSGQRLSPLARKVRLSGRTYPEMVGLSVRGLSEVVAGLSFQGRSLAIAEAPLGELKRRLSFLCEVGLDYLTLDRDARTLSGGEIQRLRLAAQLGSGLTGALYVLDEPTIGLHPRDTGRLIDNLRRLVRTGSTVLMVEHDEEVIRAADHLIDLGPFGGKRGGSVIATGSVRQVLSHKQSPTARSFSKKATPRAPLAISKSHPMLELVGARAHNLVGDLLRLPVGRMSVIAGVSGSGKSTLIRQVLLPALRQHLGLAAEAGGAFDRLSGVDSLRRAIAVDQSPIGRTPRSVPATFLGIFDPIRQLFAKSPDAQVRGFSASRFSFNTGAGRCPVCEGQGVQSHEMSFLPDVITTCPACDGLRFEDRTLEVRYLGRSIGEVLALSAEEALEVFAAHPKILAPLRVLCDLGAGYITLGQGSHTLSGGEAQRLKLAAELAVGTRHEPTLYVLDEPTTGLHLADVERLVTVLSALVTRGDTLVVIEHQPDVIRSADWIVELGPEGGPGGGRVVFEGPVAALAGVETATAIALRPRREG